MHTALYASLCGLLLVYLAFQTIKARRINKIKLGDGGIFGLQSAMRAHGNFSEYMPIIIILLFFLELNGSPVWVIHLIGVAFLIGRWIHAQGLLKDNLRKRFQGMIVTFSVLIGLSLANIVLVIVQMLDLRIISKMG